MHEHLEPQRDAGRGAAGASKAIEAGLDTKPWVKTSLAPGSRVVTDYLDRAGLTPYLDKLGFALVGYGCTTCIGNSGPLIDEVARAVDEHDLNVAAVLSGNRNFEGRVHPQVRASYLASPPLCVAYALAGRIDVDLTTEPLGEGSDGPVFLADIWPIADEVRDAMATAITESQYTTQYERIWSGDEHWQGLPTPSGPVYDWDPASTYVQEPPFFDDLGTVAAVADIEGARVLVKVGDSITTDHISPAGSIKVDSPAGAYLREHGVEPVDFNSYGSRRGNHEVMMRGTFANIRLRNEMAPGTEGSFTTHLPTGEVTSDLRGGDPLPGRGHPRWCSRARSTAAVRAATGRRRARTCWACGSCWRRASSASTGRTWWAWACCRCSTRRGSRRPRSGWTGRETFAVRDLAAGITPGQQATVEVSREDGTTTSSRVTVGSTPPPRSSTTRAAASCGWCSGAHAGRLSPADRSTEPGVVVWRAR